MSQSHPPAIDIVEVPATGARIGFTLCPGMKLPGMLGPWDRDLDADCEAIAAWGAVAVATLIEDREIEALTVRDLPSVVEALGMDWHHLPIPDKHAPDEPVEVRWTYAGERLR